MKKSLRTFIMLLVCAVISCGIVVQAYASPLPDTHTMSVSPNSDIIEWRYKVENGELYKRQYNCTKQKWIGEWVLVE